MAAIDIREFAGQMPRVSDRLIPDKFSTRAVDVDVEDFNLRPHRTSVAVPDITFNSRPLTLVPHYEAPTESTPSSSSGDFDGWFWLPHKTTVATGLIPTDLYDRVFFQGTDGSMRATDGDNIALSGNTPSVTAHWRLGVPAPVSAPTVSISGTPGGSPEFRTYVYTYVDAWGAEGPPSPVSATIEVELGENVTVGGFAAPVVTPPTDWNLATGFIRVYRAVTGSAGTDFLFAGEITLVTSTFVDNLAYESLGEVLPSRGWFPPPAVLDGFAMLPNGILVGFLGTTLYLSENYRPHAWPPTYTLALPYKILAVVPYAQSAIVLTNAMPYLVTGTLPRAPSFRSFEVNEPCIDEDSVLSIGNSVYYASPNGLIRIHEGAVQNITEATITRRQWQKLVENGYQCVPFNDHYVGFYDTGESEDLEDPNMPAAGAFMFRPQERDLLFYSDITDLPVTRPDTELVYLVKASGEAWVLHEWDSEEGSSKTFNWMSKRFNLPRPLSFSCGAVIADEYPVTLFLYSDKGSVIRKTVLDNQPFRLPGVNKYEVMWFEIEAETVVHQVSLAQSINELKEL